MKRHLIMVFIVVSAVLIGACASERLVVPAESQPLADKAANDALVDLAVCGSSSTLAAWPLIYAEGTGLFEKHGLRVNSQIISGGSDAMTALLAGDVDICQIAGAAVANAALATDEPIIVAGLINRQPYSLVVASDIDGPDDLRGKALAVSSPGSSSDTVLRAILPTLGLTPDDDVTIVGVGGQAERLAAMESGQVAGSLFTLAELGNATSLGYRVLLGVNDIDLPFQADTVVTTRSYLRENQETVEKYLKALIEARAAMAQDVEHGSTVIISGLGINGDQERANVVAIYPSVIADYLERVPYPSRAGVAALLEQGARENAAARAVTADDVIDTSIVEALDASGFIDDLYRQP